MSVLLKEQKESHPAYGCLQISRVSGGNNNFFGSSLNPNNFINFRLYSAEIGIGITDTSVSPKKILASFRMTNSQFAEAITSLNHGAGTPCTIEYVNNERVEPLKNHDLHQKTKESIVDLISIDLKDRLDSLETLSSEINEILLTKNTLNKETKKQLMGQISNFKSSISSSLDFYLECFQERMDKIEADSKTEIEAHINSVISQAGMESLGISKLKEIK